jgi:TonB family protein
LIEIPSTIPPIDLGERRFDPRDFTGIGHENNVADPSGSTPAGGIYDANAVLDGFDPAVLLAQPMPRYPAALQSAGVAGSVVVEFVIDTTGRVERPSVRMVESSHPAFEDAAQAAVLGARFRPARLNGRPVRQITQQRVRFVAID